MARLIILIAVLAAALILWHKIKNASGAERKKLVLWSIIGGILTVLAVLAVTGHLNLITAMIAGAIALLPRAVSLLKYLPFLSRLYHQNRTQTGTQGGQNGSQRPPPNAGSETMTMEKAREILSLKPGHSREDVIKAHRRMMQKVHPDRGGSDYLAAQINRAKDTLLG